MDELSQDVCSQGCFVIDFLTVLWGEDFPWAELRCMHNGAIAQEFYQPSELNALIGSAWDWDAKGWDAYMGVLPRLRQGGKAEDCTPKTSVLWADVDSKALDGTKMAALLALGRSPITPSIVVDSGNGIHSYWLLRDPVPFSMASEAMRGLAATIGGDHTYDAPRVLRLPGTRNHKSNPPKPVRLLHFEPSRRHWFSDFSDYLPEPVERPIREHTSGPRNYDQLPEWLRELVEEPTPQGYRSGAIFKAMLWLIRYGWEYDDIHDLLLDFPEGFGEKVADMKEKDAERWIARTYRRAETAAIEDDAA